MQGDRNIFYHERGPIYKDQPNQPDELPGWYFWDETQAFYHGPFNTLWDAEEGLIRHCESL
jgi:hypothetical protein